VYAGNERSMGLGEKREMGARRCNSDRGDKKSVGFMEVK
jgi:hypothetical protein